MATDNKDFKVKNGLVVGNGGTFGGTVTVAYPTLSNHAATKDYVDNQSGAIPVLSEAPANPSLGQTYFDTVTQRINIYDGTVWIAIASLSDAEFLQNHIHDTAIDGTGEVVTIFQTGGVYNDPAALVSAGFYDTTSWSSTWDGGIAIDNFN